MIKPATTEFKLSWNFQWKLIRKSLLYSKNSISCKLAEILLRQICSESESHTLMSAEVFGEVLLKTGYL